RPLVTFGFDVLTLAGNHLADAGSEGIIDTIRWLKENQLHYVGAGLNEEEAFRPLIVTRAGTRVGILKYNCVGPEETWATPHKPGGAYVKVLTHYELQHANPGGPPLHLYLCRSPLPSKNGRCDPVLAFAVRHLD